MKEEFWHQTNWNDHTARLLPEVAEMRGNRMRIYQIEKHLKLTNSFHRAEIHNDNAFAGFKSERISRQEIDWDAAKVAEHKEKYGI